MGKVGNLTRLVDVVDPTVPTRGCGGRSLRMVLVGTLTLAIGLFAVAISGAAPPTEASVDVFDQCANGAPPGSATGCSDKWINGILNTNNSHYAEDDVTPQRVILELPAGGPPTGRTVEITYQTRKGGVHAYDSLATWNYTQDADRCADIPAADCVPGPASTFGMPDDNTIVADNNPPSTWTATAGHQLPAADRLFTMYGGTITAVFEPSHSDASGTGDEDASVLVTYSVPDLSSDAKVMLLFGGHIAASLGPRGWGAGVGAGSISGGPYHVRITAADGSSVGNRDNQIMSGAILAPANIVINKVAVGGDGTFGYTATGGISSAFSIATSGGLGSQSFTSLSAGSYTVTESAPPLEWDFTSLECADEDGDSSESGMTSNIVLAAGETATCTYTNTKRGSIVIDKVTVPSGDPQSFPFTLTGPDAVNQPFSLTDAAAPHDSGLVKPGTYAASETSVPAGWDLTSQTCSDGSSPGSIDLGAGETVTCTFTNTKRATLVVYKQVVNDNGGDAVESDWQMNVSGPTNASFAGSPTGTSTEVLAGSYTVGESGGPSGYALSYPTTGLPAGVAANDCTAQGAVSVGPGETKRCVLRNDDQPGSLTVIKHVINDNGGTDVAGDFAITVTGSSPSPANFAGAEAPGTSVVIRSGSYGVTEVEDPGYTASYSVDCSGSIALGESKTCTITNDDKAASLTVIKHVVNDNGGTKTAAEFAITVTGNSPTPANFAGSESGTNVAIGPGSYDVTEVEDPGYTASYSADCTGSIALGDSRTCTITNDDKAASLTVIKNVINDNGGDKVASDFAITVTGNNPNPGNFPGAESPGTSVGIGPGGYDVTEVEDPGYTASYSADCTGSIALGESKTCTITNDDNAPTLTLVKEVVNDNGGLAQPSGWTLTATGPTGFSGLGPSVSSGAGFDQGSYDLSEAGPAGYDASDWSCTGGQADADTVDVGLGDDITCTIVNNDEPASLTVIKHVINDNGGTLVAGDFPIQVSGSNPNPASFPGAEDPGTAVAIEPGAYSVTETEDPDYTASYSAACAGSIALGESKTCTITNDDRAPTLTLVKEVVNDDGGLAQPNAWTLTATGATGFSGPGPSVSSGASFDQGGYDLSESGPAGYDASDWNCTGESQVDADTVSVGLGENVTCTIVNDDQPATLIVRKVVINNDGGTRQAQDFSFQVNLGAASPFEADGQNDLIVNAGSYNVTEPAVAGYTTSYSNCSNLVIPNGGSATCTVTNNDVPRGVGSISVSKSADPTSLKEPGGPVTFSVTITNTSVDVVVTIDNVVDDKFGDLDDSGGNGCFDVPINLAPGEKVNCTFQKTITGVGGSSHVNTVTVTGHDPANHTLTASDDARVDITPRLIDLVIVKEASSPTPLNGIVNYTLTVTNKGPDAATNVQLADPAPAGITYLTANPSQGACSLSPSLITCSLGTIAPGQTVTIAVTGRATTVGTHTNTATVTGAGGRETNPADNVDSAVTVVPAPLKPPAVKPEPNPCLTLTVSPKMIKADGKPDPVSVKVTAGKKRMKNVKVVVSGAGVKKSAMSNGKGVALLRINPRKAGIITITALEPNREVCGAKRIGVVGVFLPPLTG